MCLCSQVRLLSPTCLLRIPSSSEGDEEQPAVQDLSSFERPPRQAARDHPGDATTVQTHSARDLICVTYASYNSAVRESSLPRLCVGLSAVLHGKDSMLCRGGQKGGIFPAILSLVWQEGSQFMDTVAGYKAKQQMTIHSIINPQEQEAIGAAVQQQKSFGFDRPHGYKPHSTLTVVSNSGQETESSAPVISRQERNMNKCSLENLCM